MDKLTTLAISYPDFQLNQIIDPEQMDLNNLQIVNKINNIIKSFNELIQGTSGAGNITIAPIPEFSDATTVQQALQQIATFVKTLDADAKRQFAELVQKNSQQDTEIQSIKSVNTQQDSRLQSLESTQTNHTQCIGAIEQKNTSQDNEINAIKQKNNEQDGRLTTAEGTINTHTKQIQSINAKDTEQDKRISGIESREELDTAFVTKIEKRVGVNETDIQKLQEDFAQLEGKDPVAELVVARTSGHTQETFRTLGDRLDHNEIPVKTDFTGQLRGAVNFRVVDENTTETWENHVKLGDITAHDESPIAHEVMMAEHEMDETSHSDIREKIATHETSGNSHNDIREKIIGLGEKDLELDKKINVLSTDRGYTSSCILSKDIDVNTIKDNGKYYNRALTNSPTGSNGSWGSIDVTQANTSMYTHLYHYPEIEKSFLKYIYNSKIVTKEIAITTKTDISLVNQWTKPIGDMNQYVSKNGNTVTVNVSIKGGISNENTVIFTLPDGFKPNSNVVIAGAKNWSKDEVSRFITVRTNGEVVVRRGFNSSDTYILDFSFSIH